jgi:hypothetical protein
MLHPHQLGSDVSNTLRVDYEKIQRDYDNDGIGWRGTMTPVSHDIMTPN